MQQSRKHQDVPNIMRVQHQASTIWQCGPEIAADCFPPPALIVPKTNLSFKQSEITKPNTSKHHLPSLLHHNTLETHQNQSCPSCRRRAWIQLAAQ